MDEMEEIDVIRSEITAIEKYVDRRTFNLRVLKTMCEELVIMVTNYNDRIEEEIGGLAENVSI